MHDRHGRNAGDAVMHLAVTVSAAHAARWMPLFTAAFPGARIDAREPGSPVRSAMPPADFVVMVDPCATVFDEQPTPRAIFTASAGVGHVLRLPNLPAGVPLVRLEDGGMALPMIRYVLAVVLGFAQGLPTYARQQRAGRWVKHPLRAPADITVGVLGLGIIGAAIARAVAAQGFAVRGFAQSHKAVEGVCCYAGAAGFEAFLAHTDVLVNVLPETAATTGLINRAAMRQLADGAHIINIGRGNALVEGDLIDLLDAGKLGGATLDVFATEPLPPEHPYWQRSDIAITPHVAGPTVPDATVAQIAAKLAQLERGEAITGIVDVGREY